jgi:hypothetical protein
MHPLLLLTDAEELHILNMTKDDNIERMGGKNIKFSNESKHIRCQKHTCHISIYNHPPLSRVLHYKIFSRLQTFSTLAFVLPCIIEHHLRRAFALLLNLKRISINVACICEESRVLTYIIVIVDVVVADVYDEFIKTEG